MLFCFSAILLKGLNHGETPQPWLGSYTGMRGNYRLSVRLQSHAVNTVEGNQLLQRGGENGICYIRHFFAQHTVSQLPFFCQHTDPGVKIYAAA